MLRLIQIPALVALTALLAISCADPVPDDYVPELVVEGFCIADRPLTNVRVFLSQPISDTFSLAKATVRDAEVLVTENGIPITMQFVDDSAGGFYAAADTSFRVKYQSTYELLVRAAGKTLSGTAQTFSKFSWVAPPKEVMYYPGKAKENERYDSLNIAWEGTSGVGRYVIGMECVDTTGYGIYLDPPTEDTNRRVRDGEFDDGTLVSSEPTRYGFSFVSNTPVVWQAFRWFGPHTVHVYTGDAAFQAWFSLVGFGRRSSFDYRLSNIKGGLGVWAGATEITAPVFLVKDKP